MSLFGWLFHRERPQSPTLRDLVRRVDDVEADLEHLHHQFKKLRGRVTGQIRNEAPPESEEEAVRALGQQEMALGDTRNVEVENGRLLHQLRGRHGLLRG